MKKLITIASLLTALSLFALPASAAVTLKFAHAAPESDLQQDLAKHFKKKLKRAQMEILSSTSFRKGNLAVINR